MTPPMIKDKLIDEINLLPDEKLLEVYNFIHSFRLGIEKEGSNKKKDLLAYAGAWKDMSSETFDDFMQDIEKRRKNAFGNRR